MSEPDQCIICLDPLPRPSSSSESPQPAVDTATAAIAEAVEGDSSYLNIVAALDGCDHIIHDACIRSWAQKTNTCPICRKPFHSVRVYNGQDGIAISTYEVEDKKQVAEFDVQQWLGENPDEEEEESNPCPICNSAEREDILLLCDGCDAAYHTHCIGLDYIPEGDWYCMECAHLFEITDDQPEPEAASETIPRPQTARRPTGRANRGFNVRTRARLRRARRQARNMEWQGAWGQFSGRFYEMSELDLDNHDDEDEDLERFRRFQQLDRRELQRWQQRISIAQRLGARESFASNIPPQISERLQPLLPPVEETRDERRAWGALDRAREAENSSPSTRKRKARSVTGSPIEQPAQEPERKLKRPRTRRLPTHGESSAATSAPAAAGPPSRDDAEPTLVVSSLLKELEPNIHSEDEASATASGWRPFHEASSPALSPSPSAFSSPRALSLTPPPLPNLNGRPSSSDHSDSESPPIKLELRQPRPRRAHEMSPESSPTRGGDENSMRHTMTTEEKKSVNDIVRNALRPHWRAQKLTVEQYATINRDISRKLYDEVKDASSLDDESRRQTWEKRVTQEVARAISELQA
ncbi:ring finger domain-containing protein [Trichoderma breve]|uniref:Ring finger domain-containing protein n=1 Tax=Trichoderma breve TaxID=2034170 RepID=A0A9W9BFI3_9HYPO|nr:ring finger domain-containing protein [Trichoderma breve]KAJ4858958.1 ring finger domain-containing protein [Trichoderma breve]